MSEPSAPSRFRSKILSVGDECAGVRTFRLEVPADFSFIPGMWVMLNFPGQPKPSRAYSMSSSPLVKGSIEISVGRVGEFSERLFALREGDALELQGPYGKWRYDAANAHAVLISGGTGITPFRSMARYVLDSGLPNKITILYSVKTPDDVIYRGDLAKFRAAGFKVYTTVTRPQGRDWNGPVGRLDAAVVAREVADWDSAHYYLCGPASLVRELTEALHAKGVPRERLHHENWGEYECDR